MHFFAAVTAAVAALAVSSDARPASNRRSAPTMRMRAAIHDPFPSETSSASWFDKSQGEIAPEIAKLLVTASVPSVNLENIPGLVSIDCAGSTATAKFESETSVTLWETEPTLLLIASHHMCGRDMAQQFSMLLANRWSFGDDLKTVVFETADPEASGVTASFKLEALPAIDMPKPDLDGLTIANKFGLPDLKFDNERSIPIKFEKIMTGDISFPIQGTPMTIEARCTDCGVAGDTVLKLSAQGSLIPFSFGVSAEWSGSLQAGIDMEYNIPGTSSIAIQSTAVSFVEINLLPIIIPGILNTSSTFRMYGRTNYSVRDATNVKVKLGADIPKFNVSLSSYGGLFAEGIAPNLTSSFYRSAPGEGTVDFLLVPELTVSATIFGKNLGPATAVARIQISESSSMHQVGENGVCIRSDVQTIFEASILSNSKTVPVLKPTTITNSCIDRDDE